MHKFLFTGPTLSWIDIKDLKLSSNIVRLKNIENLDECIPMDENTIFIVPPVSGGDLYKFINYKTEFLIAIVDGYFENRISVWHKEILYLLANGKTVLGASSMGALRAAELSPYGMIGIGEIYNKFASGEYEDDDEVTVSHGPSELGYPQISEAMVNIRFTLEAALKHNVISQEIYRRSLEVAKSTFYKKRNYGSIIRDCIDYHGLHERDFSRFLLWIQRYRIDQKKADAIKLIQFIDHCKTTADLPNLCNFEFEDTILWRSSIRA